MVIRTLLSQGLTPKDVTLAEVHAPAVLLVTHDVDEAIELADRVVVLEQGRVAADVPVELAPSGPERAEDFATPRRCLLAKLGVHDSLAERDPLPRPANDRAPMVQARD